jgi:hypothetical protein
MAKFHGRMKGGYGYSNGKVITDCYNKDAISVTAESYLGSVEVKLWEYKNINTYDWDEPGTLMVEIVAGVDFGTKTIFKGKYEDFINKLSK